MKIMLLILFTTLSFAQAQAQYLSYAPVSNNCGFNKANEYYKDSVAPRKFIKGGPGMVIGGAFIATGITFLSAASYANTPNMNGNQYVPVGVLSLIEGVIIFSVGVTRYATYRKTNKYALHCDATHLGIAYNF